MTLEDRMWSYITLEGAAGRLGVTTSDVEEAAGKLGIPTKCALGSHLYPLSAFEALRQEIQGDQR